MSQNKITKEEKEYLKQCKSWFKTQDCAIDSCLLAIKEAKRKIALCKRRIKLEVAELKAKRATKAEVQKVVNSILKRAGK